jgi:hypothetical protein
MMFTLGSLVSLFARSRSSLLSFATLGSSPPFRDYARSRCSFGVSAALLATLGLAALSLLATLGLAVLSLPATLGLAVLSLPATLGLAALSLPATLGLAALSPLTTLGLAALAFSPFASCDILVTRLSPPAIFW